MCPGGGTAKFPVMFSSEIKSVHFIGIGGTATALVLQVLGVIEPNLLAAYSSNLFGITCVALVKIRHVRPYKRTLILESQVQTGVKLAAVSAS